MALKGVDADALRRFLREHLGAAPGASQLRADAEANSPKCMGLELDRSEWMNEWMNEYDDDDDDDDEGIFYGRWGMVV